MGKECCSCTVSCLFFLGRVLLCLIFLGSGIGKFLDAEGTQAYMASKGLPMVTFLMYAAAVVEILGSLMLLLGYKTRTGAIILLLFLIPTTLIFHNFWSNPPVEQMLQMMMFMKNLAIMGGLLYIIGAGPGKLSIDYWTCSDTCSKQP